MPGTNTIFVHLLLDNCPEMKERIVRYGKSLDGYVSGPGWQLRGSTQVFDFVFDALKAEDADKKLILFAQSNGCILIPEKAPQRPAHLKVDR
jgi:hypothetical protein